jgi:hypothetical protein
MGMGHKPASIAAAVVLVSLLAEHARAAPAVGVVAAAELGGGAASVDARSGGANTVSLNGIASSFRLAAGGHVERFDFGCTGSVLEAWNVQSSSAITFQRPDQFLVLSIGPFVGYRPSIRLPLTLGARLEVARGQMTGSTSVAAAPPGFSAVEPDYFQPGNGVLVAATADYAVEGAYGAVTFGLDVTDGWLSGGGNTLHILGAAATVGYRWR